MGDNGYVLCTFGVFIIGFFLFLFFFCLFLAILQQQQKSLYDCYLLIDDDACVSRI